MVASPAELIFLILLSVASILYDSMRLILYLPNWLAGNNVNRVWIVALLKKTLTLYSILAAAIVLVMPVYLLAIDTLVYA